MSVRYPVPVYRGFQQRRVSVTVGSLDSDTTTDYSLDCQPGSYTVTGSDATLVATRELNAEPATYAVTGSAATTARGLFIEASPDLFAVQGFEALTARDLALNAQPDSFTVTGADATLDYDNTDPPRATAIKVQAHTPKPSRQVSQAIFGSRVSGSAFELNAEPGSYTLTGADATLLPTGVLDAQPASFAITGVDASLEFGAAPAEASAAVIKVKAHTPKSVVQVSQAIGGLQPTNPLQHQFIAEPGTYAITGVDPLLEASTTVNKATAPVYAHTPQQIIFGSRVFYGVEVITDGDYSLDAQPGSYTVTGVDATTARGLFVNAATTSYAITGSDAALDTGLIINAVSTSYTISGTAATTVATRVVLADPGTLTLTGVDATFTLTQPSDYVLSVEPGSYTITGFRTALNYPGDLWTDHTPGEITFTDHPVLAGVVFTDHQPDVVLFTDHTPD